ncbi:hypothetical protein SPRG_03166 [Saprolegnia parasitica CBS 223.65]|uniref:Peptidase M14 domain-containing protein n=1 Tax=Saprolegnia parasitica (strain CBS 223.65) TaxID=695850 RepID=A0A067CZJ1_SAPPC|nr:hypothetical protein SPRG_03166 [Saprolegnia parasitica CBS 223.65]KDO31951.1 hypothetical protein SPRG_03166 [Saprolegnia parasitica CBS 223.65]|eukprot:XP_012197148.1 hypothetical protein SPRG_03166 [Saprolegnia parasitica CBS 223.65]
MARYVAMLLCIALFAGVVKAQTSADVVANEACHLTHGFGSLATGALRASGFFDCFRPLSHMDAFLSALVLQHPTLLTSLIVGSANSGQAIRAYTVRSSGRRGKAPRILYLQATQHAREWIAAAAAVYVIAALLDAIMGAKDLPFDVVVVPVVNVDGYMTTWTTATQRYGRKNSRGVDLNRNWPNPFWSTAAGVQRDSDAYPGTHALSEMETSALAAYLGKMQSQLVALVDVHSYAGMVLYPYTDARTTPPPATRALVAAVASAMGSNYSSGQRLDDQVLVGTFRDYGWRTLRKPSLTIEIAGADFVVPASTIRRSGDDVVAGLYALAKGIAAGP